MRLSVKKRLSEVCRVSVIITTKNRCEILENAIRSVMSQTVKNLECIVVDDASVDCTQAKYEKDPRIIYVRIDEKDSCGGNYARNQGLARATGDVVAFLDDDDEWMPKKLEKQLELLNEHPGSVIFCGRKFKKMSSKNVFVQTVIPPKKFSGNLSRLIRTTYVTSTSCLLFPKKLLNQVGGYDEKLTFWQEYELCIRLAQIADFYFVPEALVSCLDCTNIAARVSNRVLNWKENTAYIRSKHKALYADLTLRESWEYHATLYKDAFRRCRRANKKLKSLYYGTLRLFVEFIPSRIFHIF